MENPFELINERLDRIEKLLKNINDKIEVNIGNNTSLPKIMIVEQITDYLNLTKPTIYDWFTSEKYLISKREYTCILTRKTLTNVYMRAKFQQEEKLKKK